MYGGFRYILEIKDEEYELHTDSWCKVAEGSGQSHKITKDSCELTAEGFV